MSAPKAEVSIQVIYSRRSVSLSVCFKVVLLLTLSPPFVNFAFGFVPLKQEYARHEQRREDYCGKEAGF